MVMVVVMGAIDLQEKKFGKGYLIPINTPSRGGRLAGGKIASLTPLRGVDKPVEI